MTAVGVGDTIILANGNFDTVTAGPTSTITLGNGHNDTVNAGASDTIALGNGYNDTVAFGVLPNSSPIGTETIDNFSPRHDVIELNHSLSAALTTAFATSEAAAQAVAVGDTTYSSGKALITIDASDTITLMGVAPNGMHATDFLIV